MKKNLVKLSAIIALMLLTTATYAQEFHIGAKAGANLGKIAGVAYKDNFKLGYQIGGFLEFDFTDKWGLQGEVLFNQSNQRFVIVTNKCGTKSLIRTKRWIM